MYRSPREIMILLVTLLPILIARPAGTDPIEPDLRGQASGWLTGSRTTHRWKHTAGLRYIPQLRLRTSLGGDNLLDLEGSLNGFIAESNDAQLDDHDLELYRLKLRFATNRTEIRLGLQKLNFGPATLLRPLMWFDRIDPRDPLGLTDGVWALRFRYDAPSNTSLWLWGLYPNDRTKGYELLPTADDQPELGGRLQAPFLDGELALTVHTRKVDIPYAGLGAIRENRVALDGRWDVEVGLWLESVFQQQRFDILRYEWTKMSTLGIDYTFGIGNGLYALCEHMATVLSDGLLLWEEDYQVTAYSLNYPIGLFDNISAIGFYFWDDREYSQHIAWQRTWDNWILNLSLFHYPESLDSALMDPVDLPVTGYGAQVLVVYNH
ncbi:hypothetical protein ACFL0G_03040 [Candidatus Zixiibacteriota bacterium]